MNRNRPAVLVVLGVLMLAACSRGLGMTPASVVTIYPFEPGQPGP